MFLRMLSVVFVLGFFLLVPSGHSAAQTMAHDTVTIYDIYSTGCNNNQFEIIAMSTMPSDSAISIRVFVHIEQNVYMDDIFNLDADYPCAACFFLIHLSNSNIGGRVNTPFPLPRNTPFSVVIEMRNESGVPVWRSAARINRCNGGKITDVHNDKGFQFLRNSLMEQTVTGSNQPLYWQMTPGINGRISCGKEFRQGNCSYMIQQGDTRVSLWQTVVTPLVLQSGDHYTIYVNRKSENLVGNARANVIFEFVDGTTQTVRIDLGSGNQSWEYYLYKHGTLLVQDVRQITMQVNIPPGTGKIWLDWLEVHIMPAETADALNFDDYTVLPDTESGPGLLPLPEAPDLEQ